MLSVQPIIYAQSSSTSGTTLHIVAMAKLESLSRTMASGSGPLFLMACVLCCLLSCCKPDGAAAFHGQTRDTADIVGRALFCFNDRYIYSGCQGSLRLGPQGALDVPPASTEAFCGGPCLAETELVLRCIGDIMDSFHFYNGASVGDVRFALDRGCGHTGLRGDFDVLQRLGGDGYHGDGYYYGRGSSARFVSPGNNLMPPLLLSVAVVLLCG
ncbi:uncharacterized protein LOC133909762 [Phragmites australis]|uniref:uncharacterized protein LOC133909762 n=1 Tax=Phragmites australis TaxID=29695 RepID=UPI002D785BD5|nr:uncharacterized protein LOC133909762 [Phragmites australis]